MTFKYYYDLDKNGNVVNFNANHGKYVFEYNPDEDESIPLPDSAQEVAEYLAGGYVSTTDNYYKAIRAAINAELIDPKQLLDDEDYAEWKQGDYFDDARRDCIEKQGGE